MCYCGAQGRRSISACECRREIYSEWVQGEGHKDMEHGRAEGRVHVRGHMERCICAVAVSADGRFVGSGSEDKKLNNMESGKAEGGVEIYWFKSNSKNYFKR